MNINNVKRPPKRFSTDWWSTYNIQAYGKDNLYPQRMLDLILNSPTGGTCCDRYQTFIEGNGFKDEAFSEMAVNRSGDTADDIFRLVAQDMALFHGFALHVNYNLACEVVELHHVPFQNCRLEEEGESGQVTYINVHPDWSGHKTRRGKRLLVDRSNINKIYVFNPIKSVVISQIVASGGIENYKGQILWFSMDGRYEYPKPIYDKIVSNLSTDEGLDNVKYRNTRNNFLVAGMLAHKKGVGYAIDENGNEVQSGMDDGTDFASSFDMFQGDMNSCSIIDVTYQQDEDKPELISFEPTNFDTKFTCTEASVTERIYSAFGQEPWYCIRIGKLGFSGSVLSEAYEYYNSYVSKERRAISRAFKKIFNHWAGGINPGYDYEIQPLVYVSNNGNGTSADDNGSSQSRTANRQG